MFVEFNAWLYQGYDDARAALMDVIATKLEKEAETRQTGIDKVKTLPKRIKCAPRFECTQRSWVSRSANPSQRFEVG